MLLFIITINITSIATLLLYYYYYQCNIDNNKILYKEFIDLLINSKEINDFYNLIDLKIDIRIQITRVIDKFEKLTIPLFHEELSKYISEDKIKQIEKFLTLSLQELEVVFPELINSEGLRELQKIQNSLINLGYEENISFKQKNY